MSRTLTASMQTASVDGVYRPFIAVELNFKTGFLRFNSTAQNVSFNATESSPSDDFVGVGQIGEISVVQESAELQNYSLDMGLRGIPNDLAALALGGEYQGRTCTVWLGLFDADFNVHPDPTVIFDGLMDTMSIELGETAIVTVRAQSRLSRWEEALNSRYTNEEQQILFPGDLGLEFIAQMVEKEIVWKVA